MCLWSIHFKSLRFDNFGDFEGNYGVKSKKISNLQDCILFQGSGRYPRPWIAAIEFSYPFTSLQVFCIAEEETEAEELKADVKKFLYDLRMQAEVIVVTMKSWEDQDNNLAGRENAMEAFSNARKRIADEMSKIDVAAVYSNYSEQQVSKDGQNYFAFYSVISTVMLDCSSFFIVNRAILKLNGTFHQELVPSDILSVVLYTISIILSTCGACSEVVFKSV